MNKNEQEHAAWLADKIVAGGDYAKEAAQMLRRWPAQPPQDERWQGLSHEFAMRLSEYGVAMAHRQGEKARVLAEVLQSMFAATPEQPVALSKLTDSDIVKQVKNSFDSYDHAEINRRELVQSIRAALAASTPAQQSESLRMEEDAVDALFEDGWVWDGDQWQRPPEKSTPPQPVAAEALTRDALIRNAQALLNLDADGALVPHGIGGHARTIIQAFIDQEAVK